MHFQKYSDTCGRGLNVWVIQLCCSTLKYSFLPFTTFSMFSYLQSALKKSEGLDIVFEDDSSDSEDESAPVSKHILISFRPRVAPWDGLGWTCLPHFRQVSIYS